MNFFEFHLKYTSKPVVLNFYSEVLLITNVTFACTHQYY